MTQLPVSPGDGLSRTIHERTRDSTESEGEMPVSGEGFWGGGLEEFSGLGPGRVACD